MGVGVKIRGDLGLSAQSLAELIGVSFSSIYSWKEFGETGIALSTFQETVLETLQVVIAESNEEESRSLGLQLEMWRNYSGLPYALYRLLKRRYGS